MSRSVSEASYEDQQEEDDLNLKIHHEECEGLPVGTKEEKIRKVVGRKGQRGKITSNRPKMQIKGNKIKKVRSNRLAN